ncbi:hypothetical protein OS493_022567, partial [Desmophyllum pertusum]
VKRKARLQLSFPRLTIKVVYTFSLSEKDFASVVLGCKILTSEEGIDIMKFFNSVVSSPVGFPDKERAGTILLCCRFRDVNRDNIVKGDEGWDYNSDKKECIDLVVDKDTKLYGIQMFGSQNSDYVFQSTHFYGFDVLPDSPILLRKGIKYSVGAIIDGPDSCYGIDGIENVHCHDVKFSFSECGIEDCSVKKVLKVPRYYLRNRSKPYIIVKASTPKVDSSIQCDLSEEENRELSKELPFVLSYGDLIRPTNEGHPSGLQSGNFPRSSTAYSTPDQANITDRDARDISIDQSREPSIVQPNSSVQQLSDGSREDSDDSFLADFQPIHSSHSQSDPRIALEVEDISGSEIGEPSHTVKPSAAQFPVINSPADLYTLVRNSPRRINYKKSKQNKRESLINFSSSEESKGEESEGNETGSEKEDSEDSEDENSRVSDEEFRAENERKDNEDRSTHSDSGSTSMEAQMLKELQEQVATLQDQLKLQRHAQQKTTSALEQAPIPETSSTRRPPSFHGYDSEDVNRWLDKMENYLTLRRISLASPTALAELVMSLAGPAEDFYYSLLADQKATYAELRDSLRERFANDNQSWIVWQAVSTRQQGAIEPLDTYLTDLTNKFRRLNIADADKMRYFVQGLRPEIRKTSLVGPGTSQASTKPSNTEDPKLLNILEQNNAILAAMSGKLNNLEAPEVSVSSPTNRVQVNRQAAVAAFNDSFSENTGNASGMRSEIYQLKEMIQTLGREMDSRLRDLELLENGTIDEDSPQFRGINTASIAAFSRANCNKKEAPELLKEIRRMENTFNDKLDGN